MSVFEDIWDTGKGALQDLGDVLSNIPGSDWVGNAFKNGASWIGDMAKTPGGKLALVAISNAILFPAIANIAIPSASGMEFVGAQVASVVWAVPGVVAGDDFIKTYANEVTTRAMKVLAYFGGEAAGDAAKAQMANFTDGIKKALENPALQDELNNFKSQFGNLADSEIRVKLKEANLDPESIAKRFWIRYDSAAEAVEALLHRRIYDIDGEFPIDNSPPRYSNAGLPAGSTDTRPHGGDFTKIIYPPGTFGITPPANQKSVLHQVAVLALLTSPIWVPSFLIPRLRRHGLRHPTRFFK